MVVHNTSKRRHSPVLRASKDMKAGLQAYKKLEREIAKAWIQLRKDIKERNQQAILKSSNNLMLLLGECTYMSNECMHTLNS